MIRLGIRNTFNIIPKFVLIFIVFLFITVSLLSEYGSIQKDEYEEGKLGTNYYFNDTSDTRIVIKKKDGSPISKDDFETIRKLDNVSMVYENDIMLDSSVWFQSLDDSYFSVNGFLRDIDNFDGKLDYGRMPEKDNEVVYVVQGDDYYFKEKLEDAIKKTYYYSGDKNEYSIQVVGVKYDEHWLLGSNNYIYGSNSLLSRYMKDINKEHSIVKVNTNDKNYESYNSLGYEFDIRPSDRVAKGTANVSEAINYACKDYNCKNKRFSINVSNLYYNDKIELFIANTYNEKNVNSLLGINKDNQGFGSIYINPEDYNKLFNKDSYQASVMANHVDHVSKISNKLDKLGYETLQIRNTLDNMGGDILKVLKIFKLVVTVALIVTLFFISYFVIKLILKSRNVYFSTLRILGANYKHIKRILDIELFTNATLAYITYIILTILVRYRVIYVKSIANIIEYLSVRDYVLMYIILVLMSYLISTRYSSKIFKSSAMKAYREEV